MQYGSHLIIGLEGESLTQEEKKLLPKVGGVILFERNCLSYEGLKNLCSEIFSIKTSAPLILSIDREGGVVDRLKRLSPIIKWPHFSKLNSACSLEEVETTSFYLHQELKHFGINMNFAPCLDIENKKSPLLKGRTFSKNPLRVLEIGNASIKGAIRAQVLSCAKHFPGHGGVIEDSHLVRPIDLRTHSRIMESLLPFRGAISSQVSSVMISHILYPALDSENLAPFSKKIVFDLLRTKLGFQGLILTDDLDMHALDSFSLEEIVNKSLASGVHMFICGQNKEKVKDLLEILETQKNSKSYLLRRKELENFKKRNQHLLLSKNHQELSKNREEWFQKISAQLI